MAKVHSFLLTKNGEQVSFSKEPAAVFSTLMNGQYVVTIAKAKEPRSIDQNNLMWLWFTCIEAETGTPKQVIHDYYCSKFLRRTVNWNGCEKTIVEGTSSQPKDKMSTFMNHIQADALTEFGITLPTPEDKFFEEFYQSYR